MRRVYEHRAAEPGQDRVERRPVEDRKAELLRGKP